MGIKKNLIKSTTVIAILHKNVLAIGADGQATLGDTVLKNSVKKIRKLYNDEVVVGFAGSTADSLALLQRFEDKLNTFKGNMRRSAVELTKEWRMDRYLRKLESIMIAGSKKELLMLSGTGDVLEPDESIVAIGSGGMYAYAAALSLKKHCPNLEAKDIIRESLTIAANICIYTNHNLIIETL